MKQWKQTFTTKAGWLAIVVTLICSLAGTYLAKLPGLKVIGALVLALLLGMLLQVRPKLVQRASAGTGYISNRFLRLGIILLGFRLNLIDLAHAGVKTILIACVVVTFMISLTYVLCRKFGAESELAILTASGCGICGAAAIMGISPQIQTKGSTPERKRENEVLAIAVICVMGTVFTIIEVLLHQVLNLSAVQYGVLAGGSLHEIAHAVAAGSAGGAESLQMALIMKLSRVLLLVPASVIVGILYQRKFNPSDGGQTKRKLPIPWFMLGFIATSIMGTYLTALVPITAQLVTIAYIFLGMAMAALGMTVNFKVVVKRGKTVFPPAFLTSVLLLLLVLVISKLVF